MSSESALRAGLPSGPLAFVAGISAVFRGASRIASDRALRPLALGPLFFTALLYGALFGLAFVYVDDLLAQLWAQPEEGALRVVWWLLLPLVFAALAVPLLLLFSTLAELIGGPFYDRIAVRVLDAHAIVGREPGFFRGTIPDVARSLAFVAAGVALALLAFLPGIGPGFGVLGTLIAWLGLGSSSFNSALMVTGVGLKSRLLFPFREPFLVAGVGSVVGLSLFIPLLGLIAIPSAVVGATELWARAHKAALR